MADIRISYFQTPYGELILGSRKGELCLCDWRYRKMRSKIDERIQSGLEASYTVGTSEIMDETKFQLNQYFTGDRKAFELPLLLVGTEFQEQVWNLLLQIPFGTRDTYLGLSQKLGNPEAIRAVAAANGANAIAIIVPCHRIIGSDGKLIGYAGGVQTKKKLLHLEHALPQGELPLEF